MRTKWSTADAYFLTHKNSVNKTGPEAHSCALHAALNWKRGGWDHDGSPRSSCKNSKEFQLPWLPTQKWRNKQPSIAVELWATQTRFKGEEIRREISFMAHQWGNSGAAATKWQGSARTQIHKKKKVRLKKNWLYSEHLKLTDVLSSSVMKIALFDQETPICTKKEKIIWQFARAVNSLQYLPGAKMLQL